MLYDKVRLSGAVVTRKLLRNVCMCLFVYYLHEACVHLLLFVYYFVPTEACVHLLLFVYYFVPT